MVPYVASMSGPVPMVSVLPSPHVQSKSSVESWVKPHRSGDWKSQSCDTAKTTTTNGKSHG